MDNLLQFSQESYWGQIWPEIALVLGAMAILLFDLFRPGNSEKKSNITGSFAVFFQCALLVYHLFDYLLINHTFDRSSFEGMLSHGFQGDLKRTFFLMSSVCVSVLGNRYLGGKNLGHGEFHHLTMIATAGLMLLCQSSNFIIFIFIIIVII